LTDLCNVQQLKASEIAKKMLQGIKTTLLALCVEIFELVSPKNPCCSHVCDVILVRPKDIYI